LLETGLHGEEVIRAFYRMIHTIGMYQENNPLVHDAVSKFMASAGRLLKNGDLEILIWRQRIFFQGEKLPYRKETFALTGAWLDFFQKRGIAGIRFLSHVEHAHPSEFIYLARRLNDSLKQEKPGEWLKEQLLVRGIHWVEPIREIEEPPPDEDSGAHFDDPNRVLERRKRARRSYIRALDAMKAVSRKISVHSPAGIRKVRRLAQDMVELVLEDESLMHCLASIRDYDDYTYTHSINVALLSMCMGRRIGLSHVLLEQLGVCGMLHDLGKVEISRDILHKPGRLAPEEWEVMERHPLNGVMHILRLNASAEMKSRIALGPFEHHLKLDLTGYPKTRLTRDITLFGRILSIVDTYDALTSHRAYRARTLLPNEALSLMWHRLHRQFDPILLKVFVRMMGPFPAGSVVRLNTGALGVVMGPDPGSENAGTRILLLEKDDGTGFRKGEILNLTKPNAETEITGQWILSCLSPSAVGIQPAAFLLQ